MSKLKEQDKTPVKEVNKMETSYLSDTEFKTLVIRMLNKLRGRKDSLSENFNKEKNKNKDRKHKDGSVSHEEYNN